MARIYLILFIISVFSQVQSKEISGFPKIIDGDTVKINSFKIRLEGIDAPEIKQKCRKNFLKLSVIIGFSFDKNYLCGVISKKKLVQMIKNSKIKCISFSQDRYKRYLATCYKGNRNLNKWMVKNGYAVAYLKYSNKYFMDEKYAKENKLGIWQGSFLRPDKWRKVN